MPFVFTLSEFSDARPSGGFRCERNLLSVRDHLGLFATGQGRELGGAGWMLERVGRSACPYHLQLRYL